MIRTILATTGVAFALTTGPALADCKEEMERFKQEYGDVLPEQSGSEGELGTVVQELRKAATQLREQGNDGGCEAVVTALTYIADEHRRSGEEGSQEAQQQAGQGQDAGQQSEQAQQQDEQAQQQDQQAQQQDEQAQQAGQQGEQAQQQSEQGQQQAKQDQQAEQQEAQTSQQQAATTPTEDDEVLVDEQTKAITDRTVKFVNLDMPVEAGSFLEREVRNFNETGLGEVAGVLVSTSAGPTHVIVEQGGFLGIGEKEIAIPVKKLRWDPEEKIFYLNVTEAQIEKAPAYKKNSDDWVAEINDRWYDNPSE